MIRNIREEKETGYTTAGGTSSVEAVRRIDKFEDEINEIYERIMSKVGE